MKLFRATGYASSMLAPGESRFAPHPLLVVAAVSAWIAIACNVALWRSAHAGWLDVLWMAGGCALVLGALAWRRTLKPAATVLLCAAAFLAVGAWSRQLAWTLELIHVPAHALLPALLEWRVLLLLALLELPPLIWLWRTPVRRLSGPAQMRANLVGMGAGVALMALAGVLAYI